MTALLEVADLHIGFGGLAAVRGASFTVNKGETHCLVGESGCGKSVTALAMMGLLPANAERRTAALRFDGQDIAGLSEREMSRLRGDRIAMIFQEPMTSLNPVLTVGRQIGETVQLHQGMNAAEAEKKAIEMLTLVGIPAPARRVKEYPHQLSGGMRQRVMIAMALACNPKLLIADEPTTALDVTIQAQILDLMRDLKTRLGSAIMLITHDLGVVAEMAERVVVMYAGRKVEEARVEEIFARPLHPYTRGLIGAVPKLGSSLIDGPREKLAEIPGLVPSLRKPIIGCPFASRCPIVTDVCRTVAPAIEQKAPNHVVACHYAERRMAA